MKKTIIQRMKMSIARRAGEIVLTRDFKDFGSPRAVAGALRKLVEEGTLYRIGFGVYAKAEPSILDGRPLPRQPLEALAAEALEKLGVRYRLGQAQRAYFAGRTTQIPAAIIFDVGNRKIQRRFSLGKTGVEYEKSKSWRAGTYSGSSG